MAEKLLVEKHVEFIQKLDKSQNELEYWMTEHLRVSGIYWGLVALEILNRTDALDKPKVIEYILSCQNPDGGFGGHVGHDSHLLYTMSAVQILAMYDSLDKLDKESVLKYVESLQDPETGYMMGDKWGEKDTRFAFIGLAICSMFGDINRLKVDPIIEYIQLSMNYDGGFGSGPGGESHAAQVYTCVAALAIAKRLDIVDREKLSMWLCERQVEHSGGLNGRPQKLPDVCYSWWALSSLDVLKRLHWIDSKMLAKFVTSCQDADFGGISDRPGNIADVYHTCFGICGLSLTQYSEENLTLSPIDPVYCMPTHVVERMGLSHGPNGWRNYVPESWK
ncbi:hypothetical protein BB559_006017 [Furculomyces boomerangus]|uniref:Geranylgeranyl transferase type-2 subunit beta n=2 Tax=Harpellales TaxID=61421 RepID=A0A2T9Y5A0_9FUNG|nr:hypothetical protein BB559_006657 [Furculomyces boomerangus]PVU87495.1 hypothetical protein BB559_006017 [Furculomyces boomerangus]PWA00400.1 hypothetical protein BB558_003557 [Smittium angustum]